jgi:hypothetical protein
MSLHDDYARITPYELAFGEPERADELVRAVEEEAAGRGADPDAPHAFVTMGAVEAFVRELAGTDAPAGAVHRYGALAFHAFHFTRAQRPVYLLDTHAARLLVEGAPEGEPIAPAPAGYLQLPRHLVWAPGEDDTPESVDGLFWTATGAGALHVLLATGLRPDRGGFGIVPLPEAPLAEAATWLGVDARGDGGDFASSMPGGEIDALYEVRTSGEILKLLGRFFAYAESVPEALQGPEPEEGAGEGGPQPSRLPFTRVTLHTREPDA